MEDSNSNDATAREQLLTTVLELTLQGKIGVEYGYDCKKARMAWWPTIHHECSDAAGSFDDHISAVIAAYRLYRKRGNSHPRGGGQR